jgi:hypothetical protein
MNNEQRTDSELRWFAVGLVVLLGFIATAILGQWLTLEPLLIGVVVVGVVLIGAAWWRPAWVQPVFRFWLRATYPIQVAVTYTVLFLVFVLFVSPIAVARRIFGRDALDRKIERDRVSYWSSRTKDEGKERFFKQY